MNFFSKIIEFFKNIFVKQKPKQLEEPKQQVQENITNQREMFIKNLKIEEKPKKKKRKKMETLICVGDGLGIQGELKV